MTVKELKAFLDRFDDNAICFITIWENDQMNHFQVKESGGRKLYNGKDGKKFVMVSYSDNIRPDKLFQNDTGEMIYDHERK